MGDHNSIVVRRLDFEEEMTMADTKQIEPKTRRSASASKRDIDIPAVSHFDPGLREEIESIPEPEN